MKAFYIHNPWNQAASSQVAELLITGSWCYESGIRCHSVLCEPFLAELSAIGVLPEWLWVYAGNTAFLSSSARRKLSPYEDELNYKDVSVHPASNIPPPFMDQYLELDFKLVEPKLVLPIVSEISKTTEAVYCEICGKRRINPNNSFIAFRANMSRAELPSFFTSSVLGPNTVPLFVTEDGLGALECFSMQDFELKEVGTICC